jgi:hypothetical protein
MVVRFRGTHLILQWPVHGPISFVAKAFAVVSFAVASFAVVSFAVASFAVASFAVASFAVAQFAVAQLASLFDARRQQIRIRGRNAVRQ